MSEKAAQNPQNGAPAQNTDKSKAKNKKKTLIEESPEDKKKREDLALLVERLQDPDVGVQKLALESLRTEIRTSTTSMTSIPKPLKFLRSHYAKIKEIQHAMPQNDNNVVLCDILSVLALTSGKEGDRESLHFKLKGNMGDLGTWGHEYVKNLAGEISAEYEQRTDNKQSVDDLLKLIDQIVPFDVQHNAEHEAVDLLLEVEQIEKIAPFADENNYSKLCSYLISCASYVTEPDDIKILRIALDIYTRLKKWPEAIRLSLKLNDIQAAVEMYKAVPDESLKKQVAFLLGRHHVFMTDEDPNAELINNKNLSTHFLALAKNLEILEAKTPEDVYKSSSDSKGFSANADNARQNLASTYVNAFVNCGYGKDKLMTEEGNKWLYRNKEHGMIAAAASLGMIFLWNDEGLSQIDKYMYSTEEYVKAGALLGLGIVSTNVRDEADPAFALLSEYLDNPNNTIKQTAMLGLALAYSGSQREDLKDLLLPVLEDPKSDMEVIGITSLALGIIFVGSAHSEITTIICQQLLEKPESSLNSTYARFLCLGLGLLYLGKQEQSEISMEMIKAVEHPIGKYAQATLEGCSYAGTGNVLKVQKLLDICGDHLEEKNSIHQGAAVLGLALITMGEDIGSEMILRSLDHLLQYGEPGVRRAVPLALGLISLSHPRINIMDTLSKLSHDVDEEVSMSAILSLGFIGAGSNNARIAGLLKNLAGYWSKDQNHLFVVRIAQGLLYMGKGTMTLAPYHSDKLLLSYSGLACLMGVFHGCLDLKNIILGKHHWLLFSLVGSMHPRMLMTLDEKLQPLEVSVRVGQAVDTVGQVGKPKAITGFQTYTTPVLLGYDQRAELATEEYIPLTPILEGFVVLKPNPNAPKDKEKIKIPNFNKATKS